MFRVVCYCIGVFGDAVSSLFSRQSKSFTAIEEHCVIEDDHSVAPEVLGVTKPEAAPIVPLVDLSYEETMKNRVWSILVACGLVVAFGFNLLGQDGSKPKKAPETFQAKFETTAGDFVIEVKREWSPNGADRFYQLVSSGLYDDCKFFRVVPGFMVQFGINGDPKVAAKWREATIKDDPVIKSNKRGFVTFAKSGLPNSRTSQIFISYADKNTFLDSQGFSPFGQVIEGMDVVDKINSQYGEKPDQSQVQSRGNEYLNDKFPKLDGVTKATIVEKK